MSKSVAIAVTLAAFCTAGGLASATASAAPAEWMLNGKTLTEEGQTTAALATIGKLDENSVLSGGGLTITCAGGEALASPEIIKSRKGKASDLVSTECSASPVACKVPRTIGVVPVEFEATLGSGTTVKGVIKPQSGSVLTTIKLTGESCTAEGNKPISGDIEVQGPTGQEERTDQLFETNQASGTLLLLGASSAAVKGSVLLLLASSAAWSFL